MEEVKLSHLRLKEQSHFFTKDNPIEDEIYLVLEEMDIESGGGVAQYLNTISPNLTVCPRCRVDDFTHVENCEFYERWKPTDTEE